jgi:hypothetical protein
MLSMNFTSLIWFIIFLLPILFFYFLRYLYRKQPVSSKYIWNRIINKTEGFISLKKWFIILLIIQILTAFFGVLALTDPSLIFKKKDFTGLIFLLDVSASMNAIEDNGSVMKTRMELAKEKIKEEIINNKNREMVLFTCSTDAKVIAGPTGNYNKIISQMGKVNAGEEFFNDENVTAGLESWLNKSDKKWEAFLVTGGRISSINKLAELFNNNIEVSIVGSKKENFTITGFRITNDNKAFYTVINNFNEEKKINVVMQYNDEKIFDSLSTVPIGNSYHSIDLKNSNNGRYKISINNPDNYILDNAAYFAKNEPYKIKILLIGNDNVYLNTALNNDLFDTSKIGKFSDLKNDPESFDVIISNNEKFDFNAKTNIISFGFVPENDYLKKDIKINGQLSATENFNPLTKYIDAGSVFVNDGYSIRENNSISNLFYINQKPVSALFEANGFSKIIFGFDLFNSNFGKDKSFPIFINNFFRYKIPQWDNPLAFNFETGREYLIYCNRAYKEKANDDFSVERQGPYLKIKPLKSGIFQIKIDDKIINMSSNLESSELDITPGNLMIEKNKENTSLNYTEEKMQLSIFFILLFILFLLLEWFLWNTNFILNKK